MRIICIVHVMELIRMFALVSKVVVEKKLMRERHLTRHDIGRENFVAEVSTSLRKIHL